MACGLVKEEMVNHYGLRIREYWARVNPSSFAQIEDPEVFFEGLGEEMLTMVDGLVPQLMGSAPAGEDTMARIGRENAAKRQAEEIAWADLVFVQPEQSPAEARELWAERDLSLAWLSRWADEVALGLTLAMPVEAVAEEWMLPTEFLRELVASENPDLFLSLDRSKVILAKAQDDRYRAFLSTAAAEE